MTLPDDVKEKLFYFIDITVRDYKAKQAYKQKNHIFTNVVFLLVTLTQS